MKQSIVFQIEDVDDFGDLDELDFVFNTREQPWQHNRIDWQRHVDQLRHERKFRVEYRMSEDCFYNLENMLFSKIERNTTRSRGNEPINNRIIVGTGLRYLAGG